MTPLNVAVLRRAMATNHRAGRQRHPADGGSKYVARLSRAELP